MKKTRIDLIEGWNGRGVWDHLKVRLEEAFAAQGFPVEVYIWDWENWQPGRIEPFIADIKAHDGPCIVGCHSAGANAEERILNAGCVESFAFGCNMATMPGVAHEDRPWTFPHKASRFRSWKAVVDLPNVCEIQNPDENHFNQTAGFGHTDTPKDDFVLEAIIGESLAVAALTPAPAEKLSEGA